MDTTRLPMPTAQGIDQRWSSRVHQFGQIKSAKLWKAYQRHQSMGDDVLSTNTSTRFEG
ncbi:unnamed protein product, partial [Rhizoctonia solani]